MRIIAMLHLPALPGAPANEMDAAGILGRLLRDAEALAAGGVDALLLENYGDAPFHPRRVPPETVAFMAVLAREVRARFDLPLGVNVLRNDGRAALAVAAAAGGAFIRVNVYTGARLTDQGILAGQAHRILRARRALGAGVRVFADVAVKHSAPLAGRGLREEVEETVERGRADAVIVTGAATGRPAVLEDLAAAAEAARGVPVYAGSGVTAANVAAALRHAAGVIVGTSLKHGGVTTNPVDPARVREFMAAVPELSDGK